MPTPQDTQSIQIISTPELFQTLSGMLPDLSMGALLGFATGVAVAYLGRIVLLAVGILFIAVQLLAWNGIISVDWIKLQTLTEPWLKQSGESVIPWVSRVLTNQLPFTGAFTTGLLLGIRKNV